MSTTTVSAPVGESTDLLLLVLPCVVGEAADKPLVFDSASVDRGCRVLSAYVDGPGRIGQCRFGRLHVAYRETGQASGQWNIRTQRTPDGSRHGWEELTNRATVALYADLDAQLRLADVAVADAWLAAFRAPDRNRYRVPAEEAAQARRVAVWWDRVEWLEARLRDGTCTLQMCPRGADAYLPRVDVVDTSRDGRVSYDDVAGGVVLAGSGQTIGRVTVSGRLVPLEADAPLAAPR